jgi:integrase
VDFRDSHGKRRWETYDTRKEADGALAKRIPELKRGAYRAPSEVPTFAAVAADWLEGKRNHRLSSYAQWQTHLDLHLLPTLGPLKVNQIQVRDIEALRDGRRRAGLAPTTVNKILTTVAAVFKFAIRRDLTERNPAAASERCRLSGGEVEVGADVEGTRDDVGVRPEEVLSAAEVGQLINATQGGLYRAYLLTAALTGARVGEVTALIWDDLDLDAGAMHVRRSVSWAKERGAAPSATRFRFYEPKTRSSRRTVPLTPALVSALRRWKLACPPSPLDLVFPSDDGTPKHRSVIVHRGLRPALKSAGLRRVTLHSLRHSFASALLSDGRPVTQVAALLGHSCPTVTMRVYAHWLGEGVSDPAASLAAAVCGSRTVASDADSTSAPSTIAGVTA